MKERIHEKLLTRCDQLDKWYLDRLQGQYEPFYASFDVRDAGFKIGNIDGNIYPAGFNNICQQDKDTSPELIQAYLKDKFPDAKNILLLSEDHLKNIYYWENVITLSDLLRDSGYTVVVGMLSPDLQEATELQSFSGKTIRVEKVFSDSGQLITAQGTPDLVISNNDFSNPYSDVDFSQTKMTPLRELGWYRRKKHTYFENYNNYAHEFAEHIDEDPWLFQVQTRRFENFDVSNEESRKDLGHLVDEMILEIQKKYDQYSITEKPSVFIKNNSGTYGLGVVTATSGEEVISWNYKSKKKMKATKGGGGIGEVIIQEGIPTILTEDEAVAEPVLYMLGHELAGGFLRTHDKKGTNESLNSPGAVYKRLCLSDLKVSAEGCVLENVYGWIAKLGYLAISKEAAPLKGI
jgi:glutamate--cysteine ligase